MTKQEIEKAVSDYSKSLEPMAFENLKGEETPYLLRGAYKEGIEFANNHWQEKTRWKSLIAEPPTDYGKRYFFRAESNGGPFCMPSLNKSYIEKYIDWGFTEWKEIE